MKLYLQRWGPDPIAVCEIIWADISGRSVKFFTWSGVTAVTKRGTIE
jgi:hypothetical protein